ncbi:MAG: trigger factor [Candidatus Azobacteroides sp.]|nr:trigger factor [Candidatus Azobacteroides sp.]
MNVTLNRTDSVNAAIAIEIAKADYVNEVENSLKDLRKNAVIDGFRKGMAPPSFLRQKYGKSILVEEINKLVAKSLSDYILENKLNILGEPLPAEEQASIDFDKQEDFVFTFDIGLSPTIDVQLTKDDKIPYYQIQVTEDMIDKQIEHFKARYGNHESVEEVEDKDMVKGNIVELNENGEPKTGGITHENAVLMPAYMKNEEEKAKFLSAKLQSVIVFNPYKAYEGNEAELASFLKIKKEEVKNHTDDFSFDIAEITRYKEAEVNQELFDKVFEPGTVDSEKAFRDKIKEDLAQQLIPESDYKFLLDARKLLEGKASDLQFPDAFLKRWLLASDSRRTAESVEEDYPKITEDLKFHLIKEHLIEANGITIDESEMQEYAKRATRAQFAQYGYNIPDNLAENYAQEMLKKKETYRSLGDKIFEDKLIKVLKEQVTLCPEEIALEEFQKLIN